MIRRHSQLEFDGKGNLRSECHLRTIRLADIIEMPQGLVSRDTKQGACIENRSQSFVVGTRTTWTTRHVSEEKYA